MTVDKGILIRNIYHMLAYAFNQLRANNYKDIAGEDFDEIHDLFAEILAKGVAYQLKQGLHKEYVEYSEALRTLRGCVDINRTIKYLAGRKQQLHCTYDCLSVDNIFNQILKTAIALLLANEDVKAARKSALRHLMVFFKDVGAIEPNSIKWRTLRYDRNSGTYRMLHYLCYFILDSRLLTTEDGKYRMRQFSDEHMNMLFEHFVLEYYRKHHPELHPEAKQIAWNIDRASSSIDQLPILQTDIFLSSGERTIIIDTKYYGKTMQTHYGKRTLHSNNLNQIYTYVTNHDAGHRGNVDGVLLYAKTEEEVVPDGRIVLKDGNVIMFRTLDLNKPFSGITSQLENLLL